MVQRIIPKRYHCGPTGRKTYDESSNDDSNRTERLRVAMSVFRTASRFERQVLPRALMDNLQADEMSWPLAFGKDLKGTKTHLEPREIQTEDPPTRRPSRSCVDADKDFCRQDIASESRRPRDPPNGHHCVNPKRKRDSSSPTPSPWMKRRTAESHRAATRSDYDSDSDSDSEDEPDDLEDAQTETRQIRVDELHIHFYLPAFRSVSQLACKDILKAWIRMCHPGKQTSHPYNGGDDRHRSIAEHGYPGHYTMPDYWSSDQNWHLLQSPTFNACRHTEPDHVKKPERLVLLAHLLRCQYKGFTDGTFDIEKMEESTNCFHHEYKKHWKTEYVDCLKEIYRVRRKEMEFERNEIDGDTLVTVHMPKPRGRSRKPPKKAVKAVIKAEPKEMDSGICTAPIAQMSITMRFDEAETPSEGSEPSIGMDTSSSAEHVTLDASGSESTLSESPTIGHGMSFYDSPTPYLGQGRNFVPHPNPFCSVSTPGKAQRELPLHYTHSSELSSIQNFLGQGPHGQFDYEPTAPRLGAIQMRQSGPSPAQPVAPKVENIFHPTFAGSSSGLAEALLPTDVDYSSWETDYWSPQIEPPMYTAGTDPSIPYLPCTNGPFGSSSSFPSGHAWTDGNRLMMSDDYECLDEDLR